MLPAPLWRGSIQKTIHRLRKAPQRHSQSPGAPRGSQTRARLLLPPSTAKPRWGHRAQGPHGLSRSQWSIPVLARCWQVLGSRIHLTDGWSRSLLTSVQCPHPDTTITSTNAASAPSFCPKGSWPSPCQSSIPLPTLSEHWEVTWTLSQPRGAARSPRALLEGEGAEVLPQTPSSQAVGGRILEANPPSSKLLVPPPRPLSRLQGCFRDPTQQLVYAAFPLICLRFSAPILLFL